MLMASNRQFAAEAALADISQLGLPELEIPTSWTCAQRWSQSARRWQRA
jgi:hypothetical protein